MAAIRETLADVEAMIPRYSWEIMDEEQKDLLMEKVVLPRYMKTTADGVDLGPKAWGRMLGASSGAIQKRIERLRNQASGADAAATRSRQQQGSIRSARAAIKADPSLAASLLKDSTVREAIEDAVLTGAGQTRKHAPVPDQRRELDLFKLMNDVGLAAERLVKHIDDYVPNADGRDEARRLVQDLQATESVVERWATGKNVGDEVEAFLARGED